MKLKKKILGVAMMSAFVLGSLGDVAEAQAKCTNWTQMEVLDEYCDDSDGCGFLWLKDAKKFKVSQERYCDKGGKQVRETRVHYKKSGCCN